ILSLGGKRMRPALTILAARVFGAPAEQALKPALGIEVFHNFTLMHDDIMDKAPLRRGSETVHVKWDINAAILSGDAMLVQAYQLIAQSPSAVMPKVLELFSKTALEVCEGQQMDMDFEQRQNVSVDEYIEMIRLKTSVLLAASLEIGALVGGAETADAEKLYRFGEQLGIAFQLRDDYLDVFGDSSKVGKQSGGDILADK
ncbi:MAG: polyprenyl synthetase family protein, partial [Saprospiraceae bacterium]|nr:polyprenyl synthetase family protein [Saprospiraceae bacterium]